MNLKIRKTLKENIDKTFIKNLMYQIDGIYLNIELKKAAFKAAFLSLLFSIF